jgi:hypothetical protein
VHTFHELHPDFSLITFWNFENKVIPGAQPPFGVSGVLPGTHVFQKPKLAWIFCGENEMLCNNEA